MNRDLSCPEKDIKYTFKNKDLLQEALIHTSYAHEKNLKISNERLELLGDAVLHLVLTDFLMRKYPNANEGDISVLRSYCESGAFLYDAALKLNLGEYIYLGKGEELSGGRGKESLLADAVEAIIGAVYMDGGYKNARDFILGHIGDDIIYAHEEELFTDSKSELQKLTQQLFNVLPKYNVIEESGPDHEKSYIVSVTVGTISSEGYGRTIKNAEKDAAKKAIAAIRAIDSV